jgi:hypothetical protein
MKSKYAIETIQNERKPNMHGQRAMLYKRKKHIKAKNEIKKCNRNKIERKTENM